MVFFTENDNLFFISRIFKYDFAFFFSRCNSSFFFYESNMKNKDENGNLWEENTTFSVHNDPLLAFFILYVQVYNSNK